MRFIRKSRQKFKKIKSISIFYNIVFFEILTFLTIILCLVLSAWFAMALIPVSGKCFLTLLIRLLMLDVNVYFPITASTFEGRSVFYLLR